MVPEGWLIESGDVVAFGPMAGEVLGIAVERERVRTAVFDPHGRRLVETCTDVVSKGATLKPMSPAALQKALSRDIPLCLESAQRAHVRAVGISWPTALSPTTGEPLLAHLLWRRKSIASFLDDCKDVLQGLPVVSVNDANAELLAECRWGVARTARTALGVKICGGIGGALAIQGEIHVGASGYAGEFGHLAVDIADVAAAPLPEGLQPLASLPACSCGAMDHLERFASARAIVDRLEPLTSSVGYNNRASELRTRVEEEAVKVALAQAGQLLGRALVAPVLAVDPDLVVLSAIPHHDVWLGATSAELDHFRGRTRVVLGTAPEDGGVWMAALGAAAAAIDEHVLPRLEERVQRRSA